MSIPLLPSQLHRGTPPSYSPTPDPGHTPVKTKPRIHLPHLLRALGTGPPTPDSIRASTRGEFTRLTGQDTAKCLGHLCPPPMEDTIR